MFYQFLRSHCLYVFCMDLRTSNKPFLTQHSQTGFYNWGGECLQRGTGRILYITQILFVFKSLNQIYRGTHLTYFKHVKIQRMKTANKNTSTLATRLDADTTYCYASSLLPRLKHILFDRCASGTVHCSLLKSMHLTSSSDSVRDDGRKRKQTDSVRHTILYHYTAFFPMSPSIRCFIYKPKVKFMHSPNHTGHYRV
jgi:hypothetical protein